MTNLKFGNPLQANKTSAENRGDKVLGAMKRLPNAEFEIMKVVWANEPPITTSIIMEQLEKKSNGRLKRLLPCC